MSSPPVPYDFVVIGAGPAGQKAAVQAVKAGRRVLLVDRESGPGGECVRRGTIPSKTLRASAVHLAQLRRRAAGDLALELGPRTTVESLMRRMGEVLSSHERFLRAQIERNGIECRRGRARFVSPHEVEITAPDGRKEVVRGAIVVIATGSRPRAPEGVPVDHECVLDSDSILSMIYLPRSLAVLGAGVIACEFATIFQALGVQVTMIDKGERPLSFLDPELTERFVRRFERDGGRFLARGRLAGVEPDGLGEVLTRLEGGGEVRTEKVLAALGRVACVAGLGLDAAGLSTNERGYVPVDANCRTAVPHVYAVGDVIGPPALAAAAMEQGRRAMRHALGLDPGGGGAARIPVGIYTIPEMACLGLTEAEARAKEGGCVVGRASFGEIARGVIGGDEEGMLKLVADGAGRKVLGVHVIGEGATELVHLAQMAMIGGVDVDAFVDNVFNFPTLAEAYRVAALDVVGRRGEEAGVSAALPNATALRAEQGDGARGATGRA